MEDSSFSLPGAMEAMSMGAIRPPRPFDFGSSYSLLLFFLGLIDPPSAVGSRWEKQSVAAAATAAAMGGWNFMVVYNFYMYLYYALIIIINIIGDVR